MAELYITAEGKAEKEERLSYLKNEKRPEVLEKLKVARDFGDLSENSEYDAAKKEQSIVSDYMDNGQIDNEENIEKLNKEVIVNE